MTLPLLAILCSYFLGACPFGLLIARAKGVDIRAVGSGNIGATNVFRTVGKTAGICVFLLDAAKGYVPAALFPKLMAGDPGEILTPTVLGLLCGVAAILGHNYPVYLRFKGGKGVATSGGVVIGLAPIAAGIGFLVWVAALLFTGFVSIASIASAIAVAATAWGGYAGDGPLLPFIFSMLAILIVWKHRTNLSRLMKGEEHRFTTFRRVSKQEDKP
jgi:glycerol-3-phosphate acyltransferase PlsY